MSLFEKAQQFFDALNAQDMDTVAQMISPDCDVWTPIGAFTGGEAYRDWMAPQFVAIPDFTHVLPGIIAESGQSLAFEVRASGTHSGPLATPNGEIPASGRKIDMRGADLWQFEDGLISRYHLYFDSMEFFRQLGALPDS